jgi:hypothetical protein
MCFVDDDGKHPFAGLFIAQPFAELLVLETHLGRRENRVMGLIIEIPVPVN